MAGRATRLEARAAGLQARTRVAPETLGVLVTEGREDPVTLLEWQAATRLPELVPVRYGRMSVSPFAFLRGAALPMAADLCAGATSGVDVQLCGDAHLANFGMFASPERDLLFDINDFDETVRGPFELDLKRLATSLVVAARTRGHSEHEARHAAHRAIRSYRRRMGGYAEMRAIDVYYARVDATDIMGYVDKHARAMIRGTVRSSVHHDALHELPRATELVDGGRRLIEHPPTLVRRPQDTPPLAAAVLADYRASLQEDRRELLDRYALVDYALKVVGVGSVGLGAYIALFMGIDDDDPLFLQVKEAEASVYQRYRHPGRATAPGERVVTGQRRLQAASDVLLGWAVGELGHHWYVRQHQDRKGSPVIDLMTAEELAIWGELCAWALARGHARSGEPSAIAAYIGPDASFDDAILRFAEAYADQTERDHAALVSAIRSGRVAAEQGV